MIYRVMDGWVVVLMLFGDNPLQLLCKAFGIGDLSLEPAFATRELQIANKAQIQEVFEPLFAEQSSTEALTRLSQVDILCSRSMTYRSSSTIRRPSRMAWYGRGSAFEDVLTRDFDDGRNIVEDYLKRRGWKESSSTRAYMTALRTSVASLYEVSDIITDTSFRARDLVRGGDPILITERSATRSLKQWDRIVARVVQVGSHAQISGAVLPYQRDASESVLKLFRNVAKRTDKERRKLANQVGGDVNHPAIVDAFSQNAMLRAATPAITTLWLIDIIDRAVDPPVPDIRNPEGDELLFCAVHFPLAADATADDIR